MNNPSPGIQVLSWLVTILVPVALVLTAVRLLLTPVFVQFEYRTPKFPPDPYGFTQQDRLYWSQIALNYLLNDQGISYLGDLRFPDGNPLYNQRELKHMADVKKVVQAIKKMKEVMTAEPSAMPPLLQAMKAPTRIPMTYERMTERPKRNRVRGILSESRSLTGTALL